LERLKSNDRESLCKSRWRKPRKAFPMKEARRYLSEFQVLVGVRIKSMDAIRQALHSSVPF
jgi:hypothetical protein